ncbi:MAG: hypothetical protein KGV56_01265 [Gammaproteobacteria bacterium]|nr:hypothetical protein [Gammaproteobacteria bacterium]
MKKNIITEDQRLVILQSLVACNNDANQNILQLCLAEYGHNISMDLVRTHLAWLEEQGLLEIHRLDNDFYVAEITQRGLDVAEGRGVVAGVKKPNPKY